MNRANDSKPRVAVVMSTWNGARFLDEQLASILAQESVEVSLMIRDDGSTDSTPDLIRAWSVRDSRVDFYIGENIGVVASFFDVLQRSDPGCDYVAFADQDDVWLPGKLRRAVDQLLSNGDPALPAMYYSRLTFTDAHLKTIGYSTIPANTGFQNALVQNQATGCTVVLTQSARELVCNHIPPWALMHDWWCYLVVSAFGHVVYDSQSYIFYRKHGNNVTPATPNFLQELYARTRRFLGENDIPEKVSDQVRIFRNLHYNQLKSDQQQLLDGFLNVRAQPWYHRIGYAMRMPVQRNTPVDNLIMRVLIIIGRF